MRCFRVVVAMALVCLGSSRAPAAGSRGDAGGTPEFVLGFAAGGNMSKFSFADPGNLLAPETAYQSRLAYLVGPQVRYALGSSLFLQSGLLLDVKGNQVEYNGLLAKRRSEAAAGDHTFIRETVYYVTAPLYLGVAGAVGPARPFALAGPEFGRVLAAREWSEIVVDGQRLTASKDNTRLYREFDLALGGRVGVDVPLAAGLVSVFVAYSHGVTNINDSSNRDTHHIYNRVWRFGAGWWF